MHKHNHPTYTALIIDDSEIDLFVCAYTLKLNGFKKVTAFTNVLDAINHLNESRINYHYILVDIHMPLYNGFTFIESYNSSKWHGRTSKICVLTASINPADKLMCMEKQIQFIEKPFKIENLII